MAITVLDPFIDQFTPDCINRCPTMVVHTAYKTQGPTNELIWLKMLYRIGLVFFRK